MAGSPIGVVGLTRLVNCYAVRIREKSNTSALYHNPHKTHIQHVKTTISPLSFASSYRQTTNAYQPFVQTFTRNYGRRPSGGALDGKASFIDQAKATWRKVWKKHKIAISVGVGIGTVYIAWPVFKFLGKLSLGLVGVGAVGYFAIRALKMGAYRSFYEESLDVWMDKRSMVEKEIGGPVEFPTLRQVRFQMANLEDPRGLSELCVIYTFPVRGQHAAGVVRVVGTKGNDDEMVLRLMEVNLVKSDTMTPYKLDLYHQFEPVTVLDEEGNVLAGGPDESQPRPEKKKRNEKVEEVEIIEEVVRGHQETKDENEAEKDTKTTQRRRGKTRDSVPEGEIIEEIKRHKK